MLQSFHGIKARGFLLFSFFAQNFVVNGVEVALAVLATLGVVLPAFVIMLLISSVIRNFLKYAGVQATLGGIRPAVVGLIIATASTMILSSVIGIKTVSEGFLLPAPDVIKNIVIFAIVVLVSFLYKKFRKKKISPILIILISGVLGLVLFSF